MIFNTKTAESTYIYSIKSTAQIIYYHTYTQKDLIMFLFKREDNVIDSTRKLFYYKAIIESKTVFGKNNDKDEKDYS